MAVVVHDLNWYTPFHLLRKQGEECGDGDKQVDSGVGDDAIITIIAAAVAALPGCGFLDHLRAGSTFACTCALYKVR